MQCTTSNDHRVIYFAEETKKMPHFVMIDLLPFILFYLFSSADALPKPAVLLYITPHARTLTREQDKSKLLRGRYAPHVSLSLLVTQGPRRDGGLSGTDQALPTTIYIFILFLFTYSFIYLFLHQRRQLQDKKRRIYKARYLHLKVIEVKISQ